MIDNRIDPAMLPKHWKINDAIDTMDEIIKVLEGHWEWKTSGVWNTPPAGRQFGAEPERDMIDYIRAERPGGRCLQVAALARTGDPHTSLVTGDLGTVRRIDDLGTVMGNWDSGSTLGLIPGEDSWVIL